MPDRPPTACKTPGCSGTASDRGYCAQCATANPPAQPLVNNRKQWRFLYDRARWRKPVVGLRDTKLRRNPLCETPGCRNAAEVVDHKIDHRGNEVLFWDYNNLQSLCADCHDLKTGLTHGYNRKPPTPPHVSADGRIINQGLGNNPSK